MQQYLKALGVMTLWASVITVSWGAAIAAGVLVFRWIVGAAG